MPEIRKIISKEEKQKKETRSKIIIGVILTGILVLSTAGYAFFNTGRQEIKKLDYKGVKFTLEDDNLWHFKLQEQEFATVYNPKEVENISGRLSLRLIDYSGKPLYFSFDSNREGIQEISRNIRGIERIQLACLDECKEDFPVKNCTDNIIIIKQENKSLIKQEDNCVYVFFQDNPIEAADAFLFKVLEI